MDIFSMIEGLSGEAPKTKSERDKERAVHVSKTAEGDIDLDKDIGDLSVQKMKSKKKAGAHSQMGNDAEVNAPVTCIGEYFKVVLEEAATVQDCIKQLINMGYKEILAVKTYILLGKSTVLFKQECEATHENSKVDMPMAICAGENRMELTADDFPEFDSDEISLGLIRERWVANNQMYDGCGLIYDPKFAIAVPVLPERWVDMKKELEFPLKISIFGEVITIMEEDLGIIGLANGEMVRDYLCKKYSLVLAGVELLLKDSGEMFFAECNSKKKSKGTEFDKTEYYVNKEAMLSDVVEKYVLPVTLYMANFNYSIPLTSEDFNGKCKVGREDIVKIAAKYCPTLKSADRKADVLYLQDKNIVSVAAVSGKKGL